MARLHEYQGKALLKQHGIAVPDGAAASSPEAARAIAERLGGGVVVKVQAWTTSRKAKGGVRFADSPEEVEAIARDMLAMTFGAFPVSEVLVEERIDIRDELFVSLTIDDAAQAPVLLLDLAGGSGIEQRAASVARVAVDVRQGIDEHAVSALLAKSAVAPTLHAELVRTIVSLVETARHVDARSLEINPLVTTTDGRIIAADCRITIDDYAVFRHPELGIEIARELDHPPTALEKIAYAVEEADHRGTFYFAQLEVRGAGTEASRHQGIEGGEKASRQQGIEERHEDAETRRHEAAAPSMPRSLDPSMPSTRGGVGFHGAGGGGSMMSMDAVTNEGFTLANFCDTSGNPSAAKVYRAARIILAQPGLVGYFGSGSGVASQEQFWSAYGLAKAFIEVGLSIPAVIRLGGNSEDRAVEILEDACKHLPGKVEGYKKDDTPAFCARRFAELVEEASRHQGIEASSEEGDRGQGTGDSQRGGESVGGTGVPPVNENMGGTGVPPVVLHRRRVPAFVNAPGAYSFPIGGGGGGRVWIDHESCDDDTTAIVIANSFGLLKLNREGKPVLAASEQAIAGKDSEMIALEIECRRACAGVPLVFVDLPIEGLDE